MGFHDIGKYRVIEVSEKTIKSPIRWKWKGNVKYVVMGNNNVVEVIDKVLIKKTSHFIAIKEQIIE